MIFVAVAAIVSTVVATAAAVGRDGAGLRAEAEILVRLARRSRPTRCTSWWHCGPSFALGGRNPAPHGDGWVGAEAGVDAPHRPEDADLVDELAPDVVLACARQLTAEDRRVLSAFGALSQPRSALAPVDGGRVRGRWSGQ